MVGSHGRLVGYTLSVDWKEPHGLSAGVGMSAGRNQPSPGRDNPFKSCASHGYLPLICAPGPGEAATRNDSSDEVCGGSGLERDTLIFAVLSTACSGVYALSYAKDHAHAKFH